MYKVVMKYSDGSREEDDEVFQSESDASEYGSYLVSCYHEGAEVLHMSNPGDYPLVEDDDTDYEVIKVDG
jgi:hypothetical protein